MKIGVIGDTHLRNKRFYEDTFLHLERALEELKDCDVILHTGDMFDSKDISLETLHRAYMIFRNFNNSYGKRIFAICGNHEKRARGEINAVSLLSDLGCFEYLHNRVVNVNGFSFLAMSYVNDNEAQEELKRLVEENKEKLQGKKVLMIHQNIKDYSPGDGIDLNFLKSLGFFVIVNGHIHKRIYDWPVILPGSLIATSFSEDEIKPRGVTVIDTEKENSVNFIEIKQKPLIIKTLDFKDATKEEIIKEVVKSYNEEKTRNSEAIIKIIIKGTTKSVFVDLSNVMSLKDLFIDIRLEKTELKEAVLLWQGQIEETKSKLEDETMLIKALEEKIKNPKEKLELLYDYDAEEIVNIYLKDKSDFDE
jgi:DNA repair exonuclease SbcCD nuclease subunit